MKKKLNYSILKMVTPLRAALCLLLVAALVIVGDFAVCSIAIKSEKLVLENPPFAAAGADIPVTDGEQLIVEDSGVQMFLNPKTLNIRLNDMVTGKSFNTLAQDTGINSNAYSPLVVSFLDAKNAVNEWNAYDYCMVHEDYKIKKIEKGVRFEFNLSTGDTYVLTDYLPKQISAERYEKFFVDGLEKLEKESKITAAQLSSYRGVLKTLYKKSDDEKSYITTAKSTPIKSIMTMVVSMVTALGYTQEDVASDNAEFDIEVEFSATVHIRVVMDNYLDNGQFVVKVPTYETSISDKGCTMQNIKVYPAFGCLSQFGNDGYILVPDGSGLLIPLDSYNASIPEFARPVYDNNFYMDYAFQSKYSENITMPVFGMYSFENEKSSGFFTVIESGAELAYINVNLKGKTAEDGGPGYNSVYGSFDVSQYASVNILGPYAQKSSKYLSKTENNNYDIVLRYYLFGENADYYNYSKIYREYLTNGKELKFDDRAKMYVNLLGTLNIKGTFLGVSYDKSVTMTDYADAADIYKEMSQNGEMVFNYKWALNNGKNNRLFSTAKTVSSAGRKKDLVNLVSKSKKGNEFFVETSFIRVYDTSGIFNTNLNAISDMGGDIFEMSDYRYMDGTLRTDKDYSSSVLLKPTQLSGVVDSFIKKSDDFGALYLSDMGSIYYADYSKLGYSSPIASNNVLKENLKKLSDKKTIAIDNPNSDRAVYADYAVGISRQSSGYGGYSLDVPFRHLVLNGICEYTTLNVNMSKDGADYYLLQAIETGAMPMYTFSATKVQPLMEYGIDNLYSVYYPELKDGANALYSEYKTAFEKIGTKEIWRHTVLADGVYKTDYANGVSVIVNYNRNVVNVDSLAIDAMGYRIIKED